MTLLSWRPEYEVGVALIDSEHRYIFRLINEFHDQYAGGRTMQEMRILLNRLVLYAEEHFQHEEALMRQCGYPRLAQHHTEHETLYSSIYVLHEGLSRDTASVTAATLRFLKNWMTGHIVRDDMDIGDFMRHRAVVEDKAGTLQSDAKTPPANAEAASQVVQPPV